MAEIAPQLAAWLMKYNRSMTAWLQKGGVETPAKARDGMARLTRTLVRTIPEVAFVGDEVVAAGHRRVPVRVYHPLPTRSLPVMVYLHGGGHVTGSLAVFDPLCRKIALATHHLVVAAEYRLAPEHPYPRGLQDARSVLAECFTLLDRMGLPYQRRLALAGDSAGGAMAASLAHMQQNGGQNTVGHLLLLYPLLDYTLSSPSVLSRATGYLLEKKRIEWCLSHYFQNSEDRAAVSPLFMPVPEHFPATLVVTAGFCPLGDEGRRYVHSLKSRGVAVRHMHFADMIHAFLNVEDLVPDHCSALYKAMADFLAAGMAR